MPTYPYACTECGHAFEIHQSFSDPSLTQCPECSGRLRKVFSSVGVVFKGSGFYRTDSRSKSTSTVSSNSDGGAGGSTPSDSSSASSGGTASSGSSTAASSSGSASGSSSGSKATGTSAPAAAAQG